MQKLPLPDPCLVCLGWGAGICRAWQNSGGAELVLTPPLPRGWLQVDGHSSHLEFSTSPIAADGQARLFRTRVSTFTGVEN